MHLHFILYAGKEDVLDFIYGLKGRYSRHLRNKNCVAANICSFPTQYPWGTGNVFFNATPPDGRRLGDLSKRALSRTLHSDAPDLPPDWLLGEKGFILPESYVNVRFVEELFRSPRRMNYFLMSSSKVRQRFERSEDQHPAFRDQVILNALPDLYRSLFHKQDFKDLSDGQRIETLRQIRFRFCANINQIARVTGLPCEEAAGRYRHFGDFSRKICIFVS